MYDIRYSNNLAFVDLLFNLIVGIVFLFIVSFLMINDPKKAENVEPMAEYMVILSWDADKDADIDLWIEGPSGVVGFQTPVSGSMYLDKDDLGHRNDYVFVDGKREPLYINREIINIRGFESGEYIINIHYYSAKKTYEEINANLEVIKLNPFSVVHESSSRLLSRGQEKTVVRFQMSHDGNYSGISQLPKSIVYRKRDHEHPSPPLIHGP